MSLTDIQCSMSVFFLNCSASPPSSAWLTGYEDPLIDRINQRIEDLTGLEMDTAEELQVQTEKTLLNSSCLHAIYICLCICP